MKPFDELITIGTVIKPQGRHGEVVVQPHSDRPDRFPGLEQAYLPGPGGQARRVKVTSCWPHKGRFVLKIEGVDSIDDADVLRGQDLRIGEDELEALPEGSYYHHQLIGLQAVTAEGDKVGEVFAIHHHGEVPTVAIRTARGGELLLPFVDPFVGAVDLAARTVQVTVPEEEEVAPVPADRGDGASR